MHTPRGYAFIYLKQGEILMNQNNSKYTPQFFLASLGNGGMTVAIYMYLMFLVKHPGKPMANFEHIYSVLTNGNLFISTLTGISLIGILYFAFRHFKTLFWNLKSFKEFKNQANYKEFKKSRAGISLMTIPLTLAMTINVSFILGGAFVPNLWTFVEYLFPFALLAFGVIGYLGFKMFIDYASEYLINGGIKSDESNNFSPLISSFAFAMVAVGFSASAAMSHVTATYTIGFIGAIFFMIISVAILFIEFSNGLRGILANGLNQETSHTFWIIIPILTILGITVVRLTSSIAHNVLNIDMPTGFLYVFLSIFISIQGVIGIIGYNIMDKNGYFKKYVSGPEYNPASYGLICPGVAFFVLGMFLIGWGFIENDIIAKYSYLHYSLIAALAIIQLKTIGTIFKLDKKYFSKKTDVLQTADSSGY